MPIKGQPETLSPEMLDILEATQVEGAKAMKIAILTFNKPDIKIYNNEDVIYEAFDTDSVQFNPKSYVYQATMDLTVDGTLLKRAETYAVGYVRPKPAPGQPPVPSEQTIATIPSNVIEDAFVKLVAWMKENSELVVSAIVP